MLDRVLDCNEIKKLIYVSEGIGLTCLCTPSLQKFKKKMSWTDQLIFTNVKFLDYDNNHTKQNCKKKNG